MRRAEPRRLLPATGRPSEQSLGLVVSLRVGVSRERWRAAPALAMRLAMIGTLNEGMKPLGTNRRPRFCGVFGGTGGLCSRLENR